jgi:hypothetical protein
MLDLDVRLRGRLLRLCTVAATSALTVAAGAGTASAATCGTQTQAGAGSLTVCGEDIDVIGGSYAGDVATFALSSSSGGSPAHPLDASIDWGDVITSSGAFDNPNSTSTAVNGSHSYTQSGVYTVQVTARGVIDEGGGLPTTLTATGTGTATVWQVAAEGQTNPGSGPVNTFSIREVDGGGTVQYVNSATSRTFNGTIQCADAVGNRVMIVAEDTSTGLWDRTVVEDNGSSGDRLANTMFTPPTNRKTSLTSCSDPTNVTLPDRTLTGDAITVFD